ncbi:MAG: DUF2752 domain-containing protein [Flammeovirgaceae bacterium]
MLVLVACLAGYIYVGINYAQHQQAHEAGFRVCLIKRATGIPCPSCGATRSVLAVLHGDFAKAMYYNPIGFILLLIMFFAPPLIIYDLVTKKNYFFSLYRTIESTFQRKWVAIPAILLVLANWMWNIHKDL